MCDDSSGAGDSEKVISCINMTMNDEKGDKRKAKKANEIDGASLMNV